MTTLDQQIQAAATAKREAMQKHGYGSPEHRKAQRKLATLLRQRDEADA